LEKRPRKYLFVGEDKKLPYSSRKMFSNWACRTLTRALGRPMTLTVLRHIYITKKIKDDTPDLSIDIYIIYCVSECVCVCVCVFIP
jgi:hypothetical protein